MLRATARTVEGQRTLVALTTEAFGKPPPGWRGNCYAVSTALARVVGGEAVYGHWRGPISRHSYFGKLGRGGLGFVHHGWIMLPDDSIVDPTRWCFESPEPYVYVGANDFYDRGGNVLRMEMLGPPPLADGSTVVISLTGLAAGLAGSVFGTERLTRAQVSWLAHLSPEVLGPAARPLYEQLNATGTLGALIPYDNEQWVLGS